MSAFSRVFPAVIDNTPPSSRAALWILGAVTFMRAAQSVSMLVGGADIVQGADGVPLESFPGPASEAIVAMFSIATILRLVLVGLAVLVLARYRSAAGLMLLMIVAEYLGRELSLILYPLQRVGSPLGPVVNRALLLSAIVGFVLVLVGSSRARRSPPA